VSICGKIKLNLRMKNEEYLFKEECYEIIGCAMEVHNELGHGFLEAVYQEALEIVFIQNEIPYIREKVLDIEFRSIKLQKKYSADFFCFDNIIVETKATKELTDTDLAQVLNYLKATNKKIGLLINFGSSRLQYKRVIF
jgi:GxxExxY protein